MLCSRQQSRWRSRPNASSTSRPCHGRHGALFLLNRCATTLLGPGAWVSSSCSYNLCTVKRQCTCCMHLPHASRQCMHFCCPIPNRPNALSCTSLCEATHPELFKKVHPVAMQTLLKMKKAGTTTAAAAARSATAAHLQQGHCWQAGSTTRTQPGCSPRLCCCRAAGRVPQQGL